MNNIFVLMKSSDMTTDKVLSAKIINIETGEIIDIGNSTTVDIKYEEVINRSDTDGDNN